MTSSQFSAEFRFLVEACAPPRAPLPGAGEPAITSVTPDGLKLLTLARAHRLAPLLYQRIRATGFPPLNQEVLEALEREEQMNFRRNLSLTAEWFRAWNLLNANGIDAICCKGPGLASEAFGNPGARHYQDLDIFARTPGDARRAKDLLVSQGFSLSERLSGKLEEHFQQTQCEYQLSKPDQRIFIDLHWQVFPDFFSFSFPVAEAWKRLTKVIIGSREFRSFCPADTLLILCAHGVKHGWACLSHVTDIAWLIARRFPASDEGSWKLLLHMAEAMSARRIFLTGVALAGDLFRIDLPAFVRQAIDRDRSCGILRRGAIRRLSRGAQDHLPFFEHLELVLRSRESWTTRWRYCLKGTFVPSLSDFTWMELPPALFPLYHLLRPLRILSGFLSGATAR